MPWSKANATCGVKGKPQGTPVSATEVLKFPDGQYVNKHVAKGKKKVEVAGLIWKKLAKKIQLERHILLGRLGFKWISSVIDEHLVHMQGRACKGTVCLSLFEWVRAWGAVY